jgi:hypothetical protein
MMELWAALAIYLTGGLIFSFHLEGKRSILFKVAFVFFWLPIGLAKSLWDSGSYERRRQAKERERRIRKMEDRHKNKHIIP